MITKDNAKWVLPLVQAMAEGKQLQMKGLGGWRDATEARFVNSQECYRIKPEPRVVWVSADGKAVRGQGVFTDEELSLYGWVKFVEVLD